MTRATVDRRTPDRTDDSAGAELLPCIRGPVDVLAESAESGWPQRAVQRTLRIAVATLLTVLPTGLLAGLTVLNAAVHNDVFLKYRVRVFGAPLNGLDVFVAIGLLLCIRFRRPRFRGAHGHRLLVAILLTFAAAALGGLAAARSSGAAATDVLRTMHHLLLLPAAALVTYRLTSRLQDCRWMLWSHLAAGAGAAALIIASILQRAAHVTDVNLIREIGYVSNYAGLAATLLLFSLIGGVRWLSPWLSIPLAVLCMTGQIATMSRSDWVAAASGVVGILILMLPSRKSTELARFLAATSGLVVVLVVLIGLTARATHHDLQKAIVARIASMWPDSEQRAFGTKAWDTRLPAMQEEIRLWLKSPLIGGGFGIHDVVAPDVGNRGMGFRHNTWTSTLAETGLVGFVAMILVFGGTALVSLRMARDATDATTKLVAAFGFIAVVHIAVHGFVTMSFNAPRGAILPGIICGLVLRCRSLQLRARHSAD